MPKPNWTEKSDGEGLDFGRLGWRVTASRAMPVNGHEDPLNFSVTQTDRNGNITAHPKAWGQH